MAALSLFKYTDYCSLYSVASGGASSDTPRARLRRPRARAESRPPGAGPRVLACRAACWRVPVQGLPSAITYQQGDGGRAERRGHARAPSRAAAAAPCGKACAWLTWRACVPPHCPAHSDTAPTRTTRPRPRGARRPSRAEMRRVQPRRAHRAAHPAASAGGRGGPAPLLPTAVTPRRAWHAWCSRFSPGRRGSALAVVRDSSCLCMC
mmetsp:Transcript_20530/g.55250  ORF Transcript_20530/g.55250 Transcript_20530/m.55250 type:complete len:208 (+) Transcript_20530:62-685(+)